MTQFAHAGPDASLAREIGQKLMLDLRYYCADESDSASCRTPLVNLPEELADAIARHHIGGVILFSDNLADTAQIVTLNRALQHAASKATKPAPLFISIDQEGGRVARLPRETATSMTGNMSIGATYDKHGTRFAELSAAVIAQELNALGFNVNYAPTVDVNMNAENPVINVRSFGEDPSRVATLGAAQVKAFQDNHIIASLKHFPGHGDTDVDSHTGLPVVHHDKQTVWEQDLLPFREIISQNSPGMIMTAHIQYPALDSSTLTGKDGKSIIKPATMSRAIMTDLLRGELGYRGVTVTDALDMAGISAFFDPVDAVINTFAAGVDIALMPIAIRNKQDLRRLDGLIAKVADAVQSGRLDKQEIAESAKRIAALKARYLGTTNETQNADSQIEKARKVLGAPAHRKVESALAEAAVTQLKNDHNTLPVTLKANQRIVVIMPDTRKCLAMAQALEKHSELSLKAECISLQGFDQSAALGAIANADLVIAGNATPAQSAVEIGGMDDIAAVKEHALAVKDQPAALEQLLKYAQQKGKTRIFISLRAPYDISRFGHYGDAVLASYAYNVDIDNDHQVSGPAFSALAKVLLGKYSAQGSLPVTVSGVPSMQQSENTGSR